MSWAAPLSRFRRTQPSAATRAGGVRPRRRNFLLYLLAFVVMLLVAVGSMVRFTGPQEPSVVADVIARAKTPQATAPSGLTIPVAGVRVADISDTWGQSRDGGARPHQGTDIMAPRGVAVVAANAGTVEKLFNSGAGGITAYVRSPDRRWIYYYAHLAGYAPGIAEGTQVRAGQQLGYVGDTGNAGAGNYHLHFGVSRMRVGDGWWEGEPVNPYPLLVGRATGR
jgi:peptidoglycan LD-endopeptidase LytH